MLLTVCSGLSGPASGYIVLQVSPQNTVEEVLNTFCSSKGISPSQDYVLRWQENLMLHPSKTLKKIGIKNGDRLTLGLSDDVEQAFATGKWWILAIAAMLIGSIGILYTIALLLVHPSNGIDQYGIVIDGGSSHSAVFVYKWKQMEANVTSHVSLIHQCYVEGGINGFVNKPDQLHEYMNQCLKQGVSFIPMSKRKHAHLYLAATAGMRILRAENREGALLVLSTLRDVFLRSTDLIFADEDVQILPGEEEGIGGWIAVNYLLNQFSKNMSTSAAFDVGGASVQYTVALPQPTWPTRQMDLFNQSYSVFSTSFLCYGLTEALRRYDFLLLTNSTTKLKVGTPDIEDPCMPIGIHRNVSVKSIEGYCTVQVDSRFPRTVDVRKDQALSYLKKIKEMKRIDSNIIVSSNKGKTEKGLTLPSDKYISDIFRIKGIGQPKKCEDYQKILFNKTACETLFENNQCIGKNAVPPVNHEIRAFSPFFTTLLPYFGYKSGMSLEVFQQSLYNICSQKASSISQLFDDLDQDELETLCFDGMYVYVLLTSGLGITNETWFNLNFSSEISGTPVDWALGFMLNHTASLPPFIPPQSYSIYFTILLFILFSLFFLVAVVLIRHGLKIFHRSFSYQRSLDIHMDEELQSFL